MRTKLTLLIIVLLLTVTGLVSAGEISYTVRPGDTITGIANAFGVDADAILVRNAIIDPNRIRSGMVLIIPKDGVTVPMTHVVKPGERLTDIAIRYGTTVDALIAANIITNPNYIIPGQVIILPPISGPANYPRTYVVKHGDTLQSIGHRFGVSWQALAAFNHIQNPNYIQAGMVIAIPPVDYVPSYHQPSGHDGDGYNNQPQYDGYNNPSRHDGDGYNNQQQYDGYNNPSRHDGDGYNNQQQYDGYNNPPPSQPYTHPQYTTYVVQAGDVLELIGQKFGVTAEAIRQANGITNSRAIYPGDVLIIPAPQGYTYPDGQRYGHDSHYEYQPVPRQCPTHYGKYIVRYGDTMFGIAYSCGVNVYRLAEANGILNLNLIYAGQALVIPSY